VFWLVKTILLSKAQDLYWEDVWFKSRPGNRIFWDLS